MKWAGILSTTVIAYNSYYSSQKEELARNVFLEENGFKEVCRRQGLGNLYGNGKKQP